MKLVLGRTSIIMAFSIMNGSKARVQNRKYNTQCFLFDPA